MGGADAEMLNLEGRPKNVLLDGFFQCLDYFSNVYKELRAELRFQPAVLKRAESKMEEQNPGLWHSNITLIGIHIRRDDFLQADANGWSVAPAEYYKKAMSFMLTKYPKSAFLVTGNQKTWAREELSDVGKLFFVKAEDLYLLSNCDHLIISSGSYSWWAGWLNSKGSIIYYDCYPREGSFLAKNFKAQKYYPPTWIPMH
jgi:galactoside 2-L-fucosyltransferase 1/2